MDNIVAVCTSCGRLHPNGQRCACIVERAEAIAERAHELHRMTVRAWRRPRPWSALSDGARQELTGAGLDLVEALEGGGWRLVRHPPAEPMLMHLEEPGREADYHEAELGAAPTPLGQEIERAASAASWRDVRVAWGPPDWPEQHTVAAAPVVPRYMSARDPDGQFDPRRQITEPPMLQGVTLREWLIHHTARDSAWADVVREFYMRAAETPEVASFFHAVLARPDGWEQLQRHFLAALVMVTGQGVTAGTLRSMAERHAGVTNEAGDRIDGPIYDAVIGVLVSVLREFGVPSAGIAALAAAIRPLRDVIVGDSDGTDPGGITTSGAPDVVR